MAQPDGPRRGIVLGPAADQARGLTRGPGTLLYVVGNIPGPDFFANILVLAYDATNGTPLRTIRYSSGPGNSESGASIVTELPVIST